MTVLKQIRLHEVHRALNDPLAIPQLNTLPSVGAIAGLYGFKSHNHFSRDYSEMFDELPSATLKSALSA